MATPTLPPTFLTTLKSAVALGSWPMGTEARASIWSGTKMQPMPMPWTRRGHASDQKSLPRRDVRHEQGREPVHEHAEAQERGAGRRGSRAGPR